tara:strand:- start:891 stop:1160 length:270 start_codon:yes stop_codon:yes gene_type:complete
MSLYRSASQALTVAYGSPLVLESGARAISVTLDDSSIGFTVRIDGVNEEGVPAGSSWQLQPPQPGVTGDLGIEIRAASGTPNASVIWFR